MELYLNNLTASAMLLTGIISFGIGTLFFLMVNGVSIGFSIGAAWIRDGSPVVVLQLAPHGIFEIPAFLLVSTLGLIPFWLTIAVHRGLDVEHGSFKRLGIAIGFVLILIVLLLAVAAMVESSLS